MRSRLKGQTQTLHDELRDWYARTKRDLPWRRTRDPYAIWVSEIMLQQTRVAAVIPYYARFLERFPDAAALAAAPEQDLLACWSGLGYYSRARNLHAAARTINAAGGFPRSYAALRALPGIGDYTAAAIASIAFGLPHAVVDGNVLRVLSRLTNDSGDIAASITRKRLQSVASELLDERDPAGFNQALMELGATVCLPKQPRCPACPLSGHCAARAAGTQNELPVKLRRGSRVEIEATLLVVVRAGALLLRQREGSEARMAGFWELPEAAQLPVARLGQALGSFRHSITNHDYNLHVVAASVRGTPRGYQWVAPERLNAIPLATTTRKALLFSSL
jgi:A/G-specific adenine glycosylase